MKISTMGRYGLRAMADLAAQPGGVYISLKSVAERQRISLNYLEHDFSALKKSGLVWALTGVNGGYRLADDPANITVRMVLDVLEGDMSITDKNAKRAGGTLRACLDEMVWDRIDEAVGEIVETTTLKDLAGNIH